MFLPIPDIIFNDWPSVQLAVDAIRFHLSSDASPVFDSVTLSGLTASTLVGVNASKITESVTIGTGLDYTRPTLSFSHLGIEALTDPGVDKILFWDDSATACKWLGVGNSIAITTTTVDTIQDIRTTASPQFDDLTLTGNLLVSDTHGVMAGTGDTDAALLLKAGSDAGGGVIDYALLTIEGSSENLVFQITDGSSITFSPGNITTSIGTIDFDDENLITDGDIDTTGTVGAAGFEVSSWSGLTTPIGGEDEILGITVGCDAGGEGCCTLALDGGIGGDSEGSMAFCNDAGSIMTFWPGHIEDSTGTIDFNDENLTTTGTGEFTQVTLGTDPTNVDHSVTKSYADALVAGAFWEDVDVGTVANVDLSNGLEAGDTIDDYVLVEGDRVLVKEQTDQTENGLYVVPASGAASRADDANTAGEIEGKKCIPLNGSLTKHRFYFCITGDITLGVTDIKFAEVTMMTAHNTLSGLQGGTTDQYYHSTLAQNNALVSLAGLTYASASMIKITAEDTYVIRTLAEVRTDLGLVIGTNVLAQQTIGIADDNLLEVDDTDAASTDYARFTANGLQGRDATEVKTDLGLVIGTNVQAWDAGLDSLAGLTYASDSFIKVTAENTYAIRTLAETKTDLSLNLVENTAISSWTGSGNITTVGALATGSIAAGFTEIATDYTAAKCTDATADNTAGNETSHADVVVDGDFTSNGILNRTGAGAYSILALGTDVQAFGAVLDDLNTLGANAADSEFLVGTGAGALAWESGATARASIGLIIGTDVLAQQTIGIANDNLLEVDDADAADDDYAKFTANGLEGRDYVEMLGDLAETTRTVNLLQSDNTAAKQAKIDAVGKYIPFGACITFQFETGKTHTETTNLDFCGFYGGGAIFIYGNTNEADAAILHTTQDTIIDITAQTNISAIRVMYNTVTIYIRNLKIMLPDSTTSFGIYFGSNTLLIQARYNYIYAAGVVNSTFGIAVYDCPTGFMYRNYVSSLGTGIFADRSSIVSQENDETGVDPLYGIWSNNNAKIAKSTTQPDGSTANERVTSAGLILQRTHIADAPGDTTANNATTINAILVALEEAGILLTG